MKTRLALVDDNDRFREKLVQRLGFFGEIEIVVEANHPTAFVAELEGLQDPPDVALVDIDMPAMNGIEVASRLRDVYPVTGVLMLTVFEAPDTVLAAIRAGASGYLLKDASIEIIVNAIREVREGGAPMSRPIARRVLELLGGTTPAESAIEPPANAELSPREVELLEQIVSGSTEAAIADELGISPHTVRTHIKNIYRKLEVSSRAAAVRVAYEKNLISPNTRFRR